MMLSTLLGFSFAFAQQSTYARFRLDPEGELLDTIVVDADHDGQSEFWMSTLDENGVRYLIAFEQQGEDGFPAQPTMKQAVSRAVVAWSVGNFLPEEGPELLFTTREAVYVQRLGGRPVKILDAAMLLDLPAEDALPVLRDVADLDGDGLDEIVIPTRSGYTLLRGNGEVVAEIPWQPRVGRSPVAQQTLFDGRATATLSSRALSDLFVPEESPGIVTRPPLLFTSATLPRPVLKDLNGDGLIDFSFLIRDQIRVHLQQADGGFPRSVGQRFDLPPSKSQDNEVMQWGSFGGGPEADLLLVRSGGGIGVSYDWQIRVWFDVTNKQELGQPEYFSKVEGSWVRPSIEDLNGDSRPELGVSVWELSLGLTLRNPQVSHSVFVFRPLDDQPGWSSRAALSSERDYGVDDLESFAVVPSFAGDLTGNGKSDSLQSSGEGELEIRPIELGERPRIGEPSMRVPVDALAALVLVRDLNQDGVGDLLVAQLGHWEVYLSR
jgi:hypothetical protein